MRPFTWVPVLSISYNLCNWYLFKNIKCNSVEFQTHQVTPNMKNTNVRNRNCTKFRLSDIRDLQIVWATAPVPHTAPGFCYFSLTSYDRALYHVSGSQDMEEGEVQTNHQRVSPISICLDVILVLNGLKLFLRSWVFRSFWILVFNESRWSLAANLIKLV